MGCEWGGQLHAGVLVRLGTWDDQDPTPAHRPCGQRSQLPARKENSGKESAEEVALPGLRATLQADFFVYTLLL